MTTESLPDLFAFPVDPPSVAVETSEDAAASVKCLAQKLQRQVFAAILGAGGLTCDELEVRMNLKHQTCAARCWALEGQGLIQKSGMKRPTRSGRGAFVYQPTDKGLRYWRQVRDRAAA